MQSKQNITLEICHTSNICTAVYESIKDFPIKLFIDNGVKITSDVFNKNYEIIKELKKDLTKIISNNR